MADTIRTLSALQTLLANNSSGDISAQDVRDFLVSSGGVLLEEHAASASATLDFTTFYSSLYNVYRVEVINLIPATNGSKFIAYASSDGGSTWDSAGSNANYSVASNGVNASNSWFTATGTQDYFYLHREAGNSSSGGVNGSLTLYNPASTATAKVLSGQLSYYSSATSNWVLWNVTAVYTVAANAVNALRFQYDSGNITSGTIRIYGQ